VTLADEAALAEGMRRELKLAIGGVVGAAVLIFAAVLLASPAPGPVGALKPIARPVLEEPARPVAAAAPKVAEAPSHEIFIEREVDAGAGYVRTVKIPAGTVKIVSQPDCTISWEGGTLGPSPVLVTLPAGKVVATFENPRLFLKRTAIVEVAAHLQTVQTVRFGVGKLEVVGPKGTKVLFDGHPVGKLPIGLIEAVAGAHTIETVRPDGANEKAPLELIAGAQVTHTVTPPPAAD
jgi:hypothetical protein